jgi:hypothetical protein
MVWQGFFGRNVGKIFSLAQEFLFVIASFIKEVWGVLGI